MGSDEVCACALDTQRNAIDRILIRKWRFLKDEFNTENYTATWDIPELKDEESWHFWDEWKNFLHISDMPWINEDNGFRRAALYLSCAFRRHQNCCVTKTVGGYNYTKVHWGSGKVPSNCKNNCVYTRDDQPGSNYCFADGGQ